MFGHDTSVPRPSLPDLFRRAYWTRATLEAKDESRRVEESHGLTETLLSMPEITSQMAGGVGVETAPGISR